MPTVIELNIETVRRLNQQGIRAIYGDATQPDILRDAGLPTAVSLVLTPPAPPHTAELIGLARHMNPVITVLVRCAFLSQVTAMRKRRSRLHLLGRGGGRDGNDGIHAEAARGHTRADGHRTAAYPPRTVWLTAEASRSHVELGYYPQDLNRLARSVHNAGLYVLPGPLQRPYTLAR